MKLQKGFTLIELMITVAIIAILASVAMPVYTDYVTRGKIPEATSALSLSKSQMEQYFQDNRSYTTAAGACGISPANTNNFTITCTANNVTYLITATGKAGTSVEGFTYAIDQNNNKASAITAPATAAWLAVQPAGWTLPATTPLPSGGCWITKGGGNC